MVNQTLKSSGSSDSDSSNPEFALKSNYSLAPLDLDHPSTFQMGINVELFAVCDRTGVAVLRDLRIVNQNHRSKRIDRSKIRRERKEKRLSLMENVTCMVFTSM